MIRIFTDTSANLPADLIIKHSIKIIPLTFSVGGVESVQEETEDFDGKAFYNAMRAGTSVKTSMINTGTFLNAFVSFILHQYSVDLKLQTFRFEFIASKKTLRKFRSDLFSFSSSQTLCSIK